MNTILLDSHICRVPKREYSLDMKTLGCFTHLGLRGAWRRPNTRNRQRRDTKSETFSQISQKPESSSSSSTTTIDHHLTLPTLSPSSTIEHHLGFATQTSTIGKSPTTLLLHSATPSAIPVLSSPPISFRQPQSHPRHPHSSHNVYLQKNGLPMRPQRPLVCD